MEFECRPLHTSQVLAVPGKVDIWVVGICVSGRVLRTMEEVQGEHQTSNTQVSLSSQSTEILQYCLQGAYNSGKPGKLREFLNLFREFL